MQIRTMALSAAAALSVISLAPATAQDTGSPALRLTVYANGLSLVDEARTLLPSQGTAIRIDNVSPQMIADSVRVDVDGATRVQEIALDSDILSERALLERAVGKTVQVARINPATGEETIEVAEVLSVRGGMVLRMNGRIETQVPGRLVFDDVPSDLRAEPSLSVRLSAPLSTATSARVAYLTNGLGWETVYTAVLNAGHDKMNLEGWAKISNRSGIDLGPAAVSVVAGDVRRTSQPRAGKILMRAEAASMAADASPPNVVPQGLSAFHLYDVPGPVTLRDNETKQFYLLGASDIKAERVLEYRGGAQVFGPMRGESEPQAVQQRIDVANIGKNDLGIPLPSGIVRTYVRGLDNALRFIGEDRVGNVPSGGDFRLNLGQAFDVTVKKIQTDFSRIGDRVTEAAFTMTLKNGGSKSATVRVIEDIPGDWEILAQSTDHQRVGVSAAWNIKVPAEGSVDLSYRVRVRR